jgi:RNAse (barnase) inhibitor barstar
MTTPGFDFAAFDPSDVGAYLVDSDDLAMLAAAANAAGRGVRRIDLHGCRDKTTLLRRIAVALNFPDGFGRNWDALSDSLRDLSWLPATGHAFLFENADAMRDADEDDFDTLLDLIDEAADALAKRGMPMWAFFALSDDAFDALDE